MFQRLNDLLVLFEVKSTGKWFLLSGLVGAAAGLGAIAFELLAQVVAEYTLVAYAGFEPGGAAGEISIFRHDSLLLRPWMIVPIMALGGLVSGLLVHTLAPEAAGPGTDAAIDAFHNRVGHVPKRIPFVKTLASAITLGTGGSAGREGPIAQIGAGIGSYIGGTLGVSDRDRRILLAAGMAAGVGAIFRSPLAAALFAGEILYRDEEIESDVIVPAAFSSIIGYAVFSLLTPGGEQFQFVHLFGTGLGGYRLQSFAELLPLTLLAIVLVLVGTVYIRAFSLISRLFQRIPVIPHLKPMIGATLAGLVGLGCYFAMGSERPVLGVLSSGYGTLQLALEGNFAEMNDGGRWGIVHVLVVVAVGKIVTTSLTTGSGGAGGVFGPSMVIGGCLGAAVGVAVNASQPGLYAIVGMTGFFGGCAHAPISTLIMVSELTGEYKLLVPAMWVTAICFLLSRRNTLYEKQVKNRLDSPAHRGDFIVDVLEGIRVEEVYRRDLDITYIPEGMTLDAIVHVIAETQQHYYPVIDDENRFVGIFSSDDVRSYLYDETIWHLAVARDVMNSVVVSVTPQDDLNTALRRFTALNLDELPVLDPEDNGKLLGMLRRKETIAFYNRRVLEHKQAATG